MEYIYLIVPILSLILCQIIKFIIESVQKKEIILGRLINGAGGMPSTHTTFSFSLTFTIMIYEGISSPLFAIALVFSMIVAYDAMGVRMESEKQAVAINQIVNQMFKNKPKEWYTHLKEEIGHEPLEVIMGIVFAFVSSTLINFIILSIQ